MIFVFFASLWRCVFVEIISLSLVYFFDGYIKEFIGGVFVKSF
jgi:hypothetical protein